MYFAAAAFSVSPSKCQYTQVAKAIIEKSYPVVVLFREEPTQVGYELELLMPFIAFRFLWAILQNSLKSYQQPNPNFPILCNQAETAVVAVSSSFLHQCALMTEDEINDDDDNDLGDDDDDND